MTSMLRKKEYVTIITPIPGFIPRQLAIDILHSHGEVITLNPLVLEHRAIAAPRDAAADEFFSTWYEITERIQYIPGLGRMGSGKISFKGCFHNMAHGLQAHIYAPMNIDMRYKYQIGGNQPGVEPPQPLEMGMLALGAPSEGLYLREDVEVKASIAVIGFVKSQLKAASKKMVERIIKKAELVDAGVLHAMMEDGKLKTVNPADPSYATGQANPSSQGRRQSTISSPLPSPSPAFGTTTTTTTTMSDGPDHHRHSAHSSPPTQPATPASPPSMPYQVPRPQSAQIPPYGYRPPSAGRAQYPGQPAGLGLGVYNPQYTGYQNYPLQPQYSGYAGQPVDQHHAMYQYTSNMPPQQPYYAELQAPAPLPPPPQPVVSAPAPVEMAGDFYHAEAAPAPLLQNARPSSRPESASSDKGSTGPGTASATGPGGYRSPGLDKSFASDLATHRETNEEHRQETLKQLETPGSRPTTTGPASPPLKQDQNQPPHAPYSPASYVVQGP